MGRADDAPFNDPTERQPVVLVVEDELLIQLFVVDHLQKCGYHVLEASNADEAIQIIEAPTVQIDLVFSDVRMPGKMDGIGLVKWIRQNHPSIQVVLASAESIKVDLARELCDHEAFFSKPYDIHLVSQHIRAILGAHNTAD
jgi:CheY-like chemotaxis protein